MLAKQRGSLDESSTLLESVTTHDEVTDQDYVLRHDFASHQYAQRFAPTRFLASVFEPASEGPSPYRDLRVRVRIRTC